MNPGKKPVGKTNLAKSRTIHIDQVDHPVWQSRLFENSHEHLGSIHLSIRRFPYYHISAHCSRSWKITTDNGKVKRCNRQHKSFQWTILHTVMYTRTA